MNLNWKYFIRQRKVCVVRVVPLVLLTNLNKVQVQVWTNQLVCRIDTLLGQVLRFTTVSWRGNEDGRRKMADGRWFWDLIVVTSKDGIINVRRYDDAKSGESEFLMNVLTVFNEQCLRMYISLTEFVKMATTEWCLLELKWDTPIKNAILFTANLFK